MKTIFVSYVIIGAAFIVASTWWGLPFGISEPPMYGIVGGLFPTVTAIMGVVFLQIGWKRITIKSL